MSQQELAARAGLRREKVNRVESKGEDIGLDDLCRLFDAVGLELRVYAKEDAAAPSVPSAEPPAPLDARSSRAGYQLAPQEFHQAAFIDGAQARILNWGKVPR